jgi:hypothetical protein
MMTDFQNWWDGYFHEINGQKETAQAAWQARGELDAVHIKEWQSLTKEEFVAIAKSIWGDNLGMGDGYGYTVACASSYATIEPSSKMLLLLKKIDEALREKNNE